MQSAQEYYTEKYGDPLATERLFGAQHDPTGDIPDIVKHPTGDIPDIVKHGPAPPPELAEPSQPEPVRHNTMADAEAAFLKTKEDDAARKTQQKETGARPWNDEPFFDKEDPSFLGAIGNQLVNSAESLLTNMSMAPAKYFWGAAADSMEMKTGDPNNPLVVKFREASNVAKGIQESVRRENEEEGFEYTTFDELLEDFGEGAYLELTKDTGVYMAEHVLGSGVDIAALLYSAPTWALQYSERIAADIAANDGRDETTIMDHVIAIPSALFIAMLDRTGALQVLKPLKGNKAAVAMQNLADRMMSGSRLARSLYVAGVETTAEMIQEGEEYIATHLGTKKGFNWVDFLKTIGGAGLAGFGGGAVFGAASKQREINTDTGPLADVEQNTKDALDRQAEQPVETEPEVESHDPFAWDAPKLTPKEARDKALRDFGLDPYEGVEEPLGPTPEEARAAAFERAGEEMPVDQELDPLDQAVADQEKRMADLNRDRAMEINAPEIDEVTGLTEEEAAAEEARIEEEREAAFDEREPKAKAAQEDLMHGRREAQIAEDERKKAAAEKEEQDLIEEHRAPDNAGVPLEEVAAANIEEPSAKEKAAAEKQLEPVESAEPETIGEKRARLAKEKKEDAAKKKREAAAKRRQRQKVRDQEQKDNERRQAEKKKQEQNTRLKEEVGKGRMTLREALTATLLASNQPPEPETGGGGSTPKIDDAVKGALQKALKSDVESAGTTAAGEPTQYSPSDDGKGFVGYRVVNVDNQGNFISQADSRAVVPGTVGEVHDFGTKGGMWLGAGEQQVLDYYSTALGEDTDQEQALVKYQFDEADVTQGSMVGENDPELSVRKGKVLDVRELGLTVAPLTKFYAETEAKAVEAQKNRDDLRADANRLGVILGRRDKKNMIVKKIKAAVAKKAVAPAVVTQTKKSLSIESNKDGSVTINAFHGTFKEGLPSAKKPNFGGVHVGTEKAAIERLNAIRPSQNKGMPGGENIIPVQVKLKKPYGSEKNPVSENELFSIINLKNWKGKGDAGQTIHSIDRLKEQGYDGIIYENSVEDRGSLSALAFDSSSVTEKNTAQEGAERPAFGSQTVERTMTVEDPGGNSNAIKELGLFTDNPGGDWLEGQRRRAFKNIEEGMKTSGEITAGTRDNLQIDPKMLLDIPGESNEHLPGPEQRGGKGFKAERLRKQLKKDGEVKEAPFILVNPDGSAYISEGNNRVAVAAELGLPSIPVEIRWRAGGEEVKGPMSPDSVRELVRKTRQKTAVEGVPEPNPSEAQKKAGNYKKAHKSVQGLDVSIETAKGQVRTGPGWKRTMKDDYGYIKRTEGKDGDQVDVFLGENLDSDSVFIIDQVKESGRGFDEHKVMIGYRNKLDAHRGYKRNYPKGWKVGPMTEMSMADFKVWLEDGDTKTPVAPQVTQADVEAKAGRERKKLARRTAGRRLGTRNKGWLLHVLGRPEENTLPTRSYKPTFWEIEKSKELAAAKGIAPKVSVAEAKQILEPLLRELPGINPEIVGTVEDMPTETRNRLLSRHGNAIHNAGGVFNWANGRVVIFAHNAKSAEGLVETVLHEGVGHKGMSFLFNRQEMNVLLDDLIENGNQKAMIELNKLYKVNMDTRAGQRLLAEEYMAKLAQEGDNAGLLQRIVDAIRSILRRAGVVKKWTDNDIHALLRNSRREVGKVDPRTIAITTNVLDPRTGEMQRTKAPVDSLIKSLDLRVANLNKLKDCLSS